MPINRLLGQSKLMPDEIERLSKAYTFALRSLGLVDRNDPLSEIVARQVIKIGASVRDPHEIAEKTIKQLGVR